MRASAKKHAIRLLASAVWAVGSCLVVACAGPGSDAGRAPVQPYPTARRSPDEAAAKAAALASVEPAAVAPADRAAYFEAVPRTARAAREASRRQEAGDPDEPDAEALRKVLLLAQLLGTSDPELSRRVRAWLFERTGDFVEAYTSQTARVLSSAPTSPWHRSEAAWGSWVMAQLPTMTEDEAARIVRGVTGYLPQGVKAFPTVDRFTLGLAIADLWAKEGHPQVDRNRPAFENVVCSVEDDYGKLGSYCGGGKGWWYQEALSSDALTHRLAEAVLARKDPSLTAAVILGVGTTPKTLAVLSDFERDANAWRDAILAVSRVNDFHWLQDWLIPELRRVWRSHPAWRGVVLYALAQASGEHAEDDREQYGLVDFLHFSRDFEGGATRADFTSFLDQSPRALELARWIMPARTKGWSVVDLVLPRLDAYFELPRNLPARSPPGPGFGSLVGFLCYRDHDLAGLARLRAYFAKRAPSHPGDPLNALMDHYTPKECRGRG